MASIKILFFAAARDAVGSPEIIVHLNNLPENLTKNCTSEVLKEFVTEKFSLHDIGPFLLSLNEEYLEEKEICLSDGDVIGVIPPISGG